MKIDHGFYREEIEPGHSHFKRETFVPGKMVVESYELETYEKSALKNINLWLIKGKFKTHKKCRDAMEYLENLINKINRVLEQERDSGDQNLTLMEDYGRILEIYNKLKKRYAEI